MALWVNRVSLSSCTARGYRALRGVQSYTRVANSTRVKCSCCPARAALCARSLLIFVSARDTWVYFPRWIESGTKGSQVWRRNSLLITPLLREIRVKMIFWNTYLKPSNKIHDNRLLRCWAKAIKSNEVNWRKLLPETFYLGVLYTLYVVHWEEKLRKRCTDKAT